MERADITHNTWISKLPLVLLLTLTAAIYIPGIGGDFIFDDFPNLLENSRLFLKSLSTDSLIAAALSSDAGTLKRPISMLSFAFNFYFFGSDPLSFKIVNVLVHVINTSLIFCLVLMLAKGIGHRTQDEDGRQHALTALLSAAVWALHPIQLTSVLYVVQRMTSLSTLFTLIALIIYCNERHTIINGGKLSAPRILLGILSTACAILSKESGVLVPVYAFVIELAVYRFKSEDSRPSRMVIMVFALALAMPALIGLGWLVMHHDWLQSTYSIREFSLGQRLLTETRVLMLYLQFIFLPSGSTLGIFHDDIQLSTGLLTPATTLYSSVAIAFLLALSLYAVRRAPYVSLAILWYFGGHSLESTFLPLEIAHEHRNYLPILGPAVILARLFQESIYKSESPEFKRVRRALLIGWIGLLVVITSNRAAQWKDNVIHAITEAEHHPTSPRAIYSAGRIYANLALTGNSQYLPLAREHFERASALEENGILSETSLILLHAKLKMPVDPIWLGMIEEKLQKYPASFSTVAALNQLIKCMEKDCNLSTKRVEKLLVTASANENLKKVPSVYTAVLAIYATYSYAILRDAPKAAELFRRAVNASPGNTENRISLLNTLLISGNITAAEQELSVLRRLPSWEISAHRLAQIEQDISYARNRAHNPEILK